jgi:hypothetical protein
VADPRLGQQRQTIVEQLLPYLDTYSRAVWPVVITIWLVMGTSDVRRRFFPRDPA